MDPYKKRKIWTETCRGKAAMEDGGRDWNVYKPRNADGCQQQQRLEEKRRDPSPGPSEGAQPCRHLDFGLMASRCMQIGLAFFGSLGDGILFIQKLAVPCICISVGWLPGRVRRMCSGGVIVACLVKMESKMENHELHSHQDSLQHYRCLVTKSWSDSCDQIEIPLYNLGSIPGSGRFPGEENGNPLQYFPLSPFYPPDLDRRVDSPALSGRGSRPSGRTSG